jgi:hypothetical protein
MIYIVISCTYEESYKKPQVIAWFSTDSLPRYSSSIGSICFAHRPSYSASRSPTVLYFQKPFALYFPYWPFCVLFWFWLGAFWVPCWCGWIVSGLRSVQRRIFDVWFLFSSFNQKKTNKLVKFLKDRWKRCKVLINKLIAAEKYLAVPKRQKKTECTIPSQLYAFI